ncbi:MAG TPA: hypothetical protein VHM31_12200, partial [Polyangia bacterium]|nr:hypothetical protein [Polyangia bacterium]
TGHGGARATGGGAGNRGTGGTAGAPATGGTPGTGGTTGLAGSHGTGGTPATGGTAGHAGNPSGTCSTGIPAAGRAADTSTPTTVVGSGTAASCTFSALQAAVTKGGVITFSCGAAPVTIAVTATLNLPINVNTVIDGGNKVTLDGGNAVQILSFHSANFQALDTVVTLQHLNLVNGKATPTAAIPTAPAPCSQGWNDGQGGAVWMRDGNLVVVDCVFSNNHAAPRGPDTGGGAIYITGSKHGATIAGSTFSGNQGSVGGAIYSLWAELDIYDTVFSGNVGTGDGANSDDATMCSVINNGQHEVGSGGNGGAIAADGNNFNIVLCGDDFESNLAGTGAFGGALCFTSDNLAGTLSIIDTKMAGNTGGHWTNVTSGSVTNVGTAIGVNAKSITLSRSTIQGVN